jgi:signal peptidase I
MKIKEFCLQLVAKTEDFLTWNKKREEIKRAKQKQKNQILDWIEAFLWAAAVVLVVNQYLVQAYTIPSGSMIDTLLIKDRIFVNKIVYGPELIPGHLKLPGFSKPERTEVMIFESPEYDSRGPVFDVAQRLIYMLTLSMIDIDGKDARGNPKVHFLIKRLMALDGDTVRFVRGNLYIRPRGTLEWQDEESFKEVSGNRYHNSRMFQDDYYDWFYDHRVKTVLNGDKLNEMDLLRASFQEKGHADQLYAGYLYSLGEIMVNPQNGGARNQYWSLVQGQYIPENWILPLGDNRDNSNDGRFFGPVPKSKVLGRAMFIYWPLFRAGSIK